MHELRAGSTSQTIRFMFYKTDGTPYTGLLYNTPLLTCYYSRQGAGSHAVTLTTSEVGSYTTSGFVAVDGTHMPGYYEFSIPVEAIAEGARYVDIMFAGLADLYISPQRIRLTAVDPDNATNFGITRIDDTVASRMASGAAVTIAADQVVGSVTSPVVLAADQVVGSVSTPVTLAADQVVGSVTTPVTLAADQVVGSVTLPVMLAPDQVVSTVTTVTNPVLISSGVDPGQLLLTEGKVDVNDKNEFSLSMLGLVALQTAMWTADVGSYAVAVGSIAEMLALTSADASRIPSSPAAIGSEMKLKDEAISASKIAANAINAGKIADNAITVDKIADGAITNAKIADGAITYDKAVSIGTVNGNISGSVNNIVEGVSVSEESIAAMRDNLPAGALSNISDRIDLIYGTGKAIYTNTVHAGHAPSTNPLADALVWITEDIEGDVFVAGPQHSNEVGVTKWMLDVGRTYYLWCQKPRYTFSNPQVIQVS